MNNAERARRAHAIFASALDLPPAERDAAVVVACGNDTTLCAQVRRLLAATDQAGTFLERPALTKPVAPPEEVPDAVGNYLVVGVLGIGGMATVYEAVQENPNRRVALKVMHRGLADSELHLRFTMESKILARLQHPGIAQIYEAGTAQLGWPAPSPFFAMELIPTALSVTDYAEQHQLSLRDRLEMFATVCDAVLHGHQNGIIHRDLKPGNVLVGENGQPKVIDFGIARSVGVDGSGLAGVTAQSDLRRLIGTLNYMSPEQCNTPDDIDVRTDVYSLGVILYQLVTSRLPHDLSKCSTPQAVRIIVEDPPVRASMFNHDAKGDLDAIISKAMDKDRTRRYVGAGALAADIRRYLGFLPIEARPASAAYQVRKFVRRNRPLSASLAVLACTVVIGLVVVGRLAYVASRARDAALERERELALVAEFQESLLRGVDVVAMGDRLRASLVEGVEKSRGAAGGDGRAFMQLTQDLNFTSVAVRVLNESVLQRYVASLDARLSGQPLLQARLLQQLATTMNSLGLYADAEPILRRVLTTRQNALGDDDKDTLHTRHTLGSLLSTLGKYDEAIDHLRATHQLRIKTLGPDNPLTLRTGNSLGGAYRLEGGHAEAEQIWTTTLAAQRRTLGNDHPDTLRTLNNMGVLFAAIGDLERAEVCWRELVDRRRQVFGNNHPEYLSSLGNLGSLLHERGKFNEALQLLTQSLAAERRNLGDRHARTLISMAQLAMLRLEMGDLPQAEALFRECYNGRRSALGPEHPETLRSQTHLSSVLMLLDQIAEAEELITSCLQTQRRVLGESDVDTISSINSLANVRQKQGRMEEAVALSEEAIKLGRTSLSAEPGTLGQMLSIHGELLLAHGDKVAARNYLLEGYEVLRSTRGDTHPQTRSAAGRLATFYSQAHALEPAAGHDTEQALWQKRASPPTTLPATPEARKTP